MNTPIDHDATAHDADTLALALEGKKHLQRQARAIAAAMRKQEKRIKELEAVLMDAYTHLDEAVEYVPNGEQRVETINARDQILAVMGTRTEVQHGQ